MPKPKPKLADVQAVVAFLPAMESRDFTFGVHNPNKQDADGVWWVGGYSMSATANDWLKALYEHHFVDPKFVWQHAGDWVQPFQESPWMVDRTDLADIVKLLTAHARADHFGEGHLASVWESGHLLGIMRRLKVLEGEMVAAESAKGPGVRDLISSYLARVPPCTVVSNKELYAFVQKQRPTTPAPTIREALQSLAVGSSRPPSHQSKFAFAVMIRLPELAQLPGAATVFLAIPPIDRARIGAGALASTRATQEKCEKLLGAEVVRFWLKPTQLQSISLASTARRQVEKRDGNVCKLCAYVRDRRQLAGETVAVPTSENVQVAHLATRRDAFWRIVDLGLAEGGSDLAWMFTNTGAAWLRETLKEDDIHSRPAYMVQLCRVHDALIQKTLYPGTKELVDA